MATPAQILTQYGMANSDALVSAASIEGLPLYIAAAFATKESGGQNIYGHDAGGVFSYPGTTVAVTQANYADFYNQVVNQGRTSNGVGPMQITYRGYFPQAASRGLHLWVPLDNFRLGFKVIHDSLAAGRSLNAAAQAYNSGSTTGAPQYGADVDALAHLWKIRLAAATRPASPPPAGLTKLKVDGLLGPSTIKRWQQVQGTPADGVISAHSSLILKVQKYLNAKGYRGLDGRRLAEDGAFGPNTIAALQRCYHTTVDGHLSVPSQLIKAIQTQLNNL